MFIKRLLLVGVLLSPLPVAKAQGTDLSRARSGLNTKPSARASLVFRDVESLGIGKASYDETAKLASKIGARADSQCKRMSCTWSIDIEGEPYEHHERVEFLATFSVKDGSLSERAFAMRIGRGVDASFVRVSEQRELERHSDEPLKVARQSSNLTPFYRLFVWMTPAVSDPLHQGYENFAFECLDGEKPCTDAKTLLPGIDWQ